MRFADHHKIRRARQIIEDVRFSTTFLLEQINMSTRVLHIKSKQRTNSISLEGLQDFDYVEGETINPNTIIANSHISLYCLDSQNKRAIFVETPLDIELSNASFFHQAQYEYAQRLIAVPYEQLHQLAEKIGDSIEQLVLIYSVGFCGSTLLSKVFHQVDTVLSLSEPIIFSHILGIREPDGISDAELAKILHSCTLLLCKPTPTIRPSYCVLKFRGWSIEIADLMYQLFPNAKIIFLYRNAENAARSFIRATANPAFLTKNTIENKMEVLSRFIPLLKTYADLIDYTNSNAIDIYSLMWLSAMQRYMALYTQGISMCAVRYEDLIRNPQQVVTSIFQYCGLPISDVDKACRVFEQDSKSGLNFSPKNPRKNDINSQEIGEISQKVAKFLTKHPEIKTSDFIVPGTLRFDR